MHRRLSHPVTDSGPPTVDPQRVKRNYENKIGRQDSSFVAQASQVSFVYEALSNSAVSTQ